MIKKFSKILLTILLVSILLFSFVNTFAEEPVVVAAESEDQAVETTEENESTETDQEIYSGDLYLFDTNVVMDKLVDGNVFIVGENVQITGQINGNLFVIANNLTFGSTENEGSSDTTNQCYVRYSIFALATSVYYNGACNDLYVATKNLKTTFDSYVVRDVKAFSATTEFKSAVGRDLDLYSSKIDFGSEEDIPVVYGNLRYSSPSEVEIPEGVVTDSSLITYNPLYNLNNTNSVKNTVVKILLSFLTSVVTVLAIFFIIKYFMPNLNNKISNINITPLSILKALGFGILTFLAVILLIIVLFLTQVGIKIALVLLALFALLLLTCVPIFAIIITNKLKPILNLNKILIYCVVLSLVKIVLYGLTLIPYVGMVLAIIIILISLGNLILLFIPNKKIENPINKELE